jgi:hypothetical protein
MKALTVIGLIVSCLLGCGSIQNLIDCNGICGRYQSCFDSKYDTNVCEARCRDNANTDSSYMSKATACHSCLDGRDCASATFNCGTQCAGIVP